MLVMCAIPVILLSYFTAVFSSENVIPRTLLDSGLGSQSSSEELGEWNGMKIGYI